MNSFATDTDTVDQDEVMELGDVMEKFLDTHGSLDDGGGLDGLAAYILASGYAKI